MKRDAFLARVSAGIMKNELPSSPATADLPGAPPSDLLGLFRLRAQAVNTVVHGPVTRRSVSRTIAAIATGHSVVSYVAWPDLPAPGINSSLAADGFQLIGQHDGSSDSPLVATADLGITGSLFALAESGSVVLSHGPGRSRLVSLLPPVHIALVEVETIRWTLVHWARDHLEAVENTANLVIVTGPSRTGDIELQLNLGVHGPKHLHVVLIK
ncbi:MAG TPA: lactate utilization protein [Acidimicrobiia bacterium]